MNELLLLLLTLSVAGAAAGITAGLFGNGGGFVVVPALVFVFSILGDQNPDLIFVAIGTSLATIVVSSARAVRAHQRRGAVDFEVLKTWALWLVLGVFIGLIIASMTNGDRLYAIFAIGVLIYAIYFLFPDRFSNQKTPAPNMPSGLPRASLASFLGGFSGPTRHRRWDRNRHHDGDLPEANLSGGGNRVWGGFHHWPSGRCRLRIHGPRSTFSPLRLYRLREFPGAIDGRSDVNSNCATRGEMGTHP